MSIVSQHVPTSLKMFQLLEEQIVIFKQETLDFQIIFNGNFKNNAMGKNILYEYTENCKEIVMKRGDI